MVGPVVLPKAIEAANNPRAHPLCSCPYTEAMIAAAMGAAITKPSAMRQRNASNCGKVPEKAAQPAPTVYRAIPTLKIVLLPIRSPARPKQSERLESMIDPIKPIHWTAARVVSNSFWMAASDTLILPTLWMWKNVPRQTTKRTRDSSLIKMNLLKQNLFYTTARAGLVEKMRFYICPDALFVFKLLLFVLDNGQRRT